MEVFHELQAVVLLNSFFFIAKSMGFLFVCFFVCFLTFHFILLFFFFIL